MKQYHSQYWAFTLHGTHEEIEEVPKALKELTLHFTNIFNSPFNKKKGAEAPVSKQSGITENDSFLRSSYYDESHSKLI